MYLFLFCCSFFFPNFHPFIFCFLAFLLSDFLLSCFLSFFVFSFFLFLSYLSFFCLCSFFSLRSSLAFLVPFSSSSSLCLLPSLFCLLALFCLYLSSFSFTYSSLSLSLRGSFSVSLCGALLRPSQKPLLKPLRLPRGRRPAF